MTTTRWIKFQAPAELALIAAAGYGASPERIRTAGTFRAACSLKFPFVRRFRRDTRDNNVCAHPLARVRECEYAPTTPNDPFLCSSSSCTGSQSVALGRQDSDRFVSDSGPTSNLHAESADPRVNVRR